jgi:hypothetical protein
VIALLRLEWKRSGWLLVLPVVALSLPLVVQEVVSLWVSPRSELYALLLAMWILTPFTAGWALFRQDPPLGAGEWLRHRGVSRERLFAGRFLYGALLAGALVLVPLGVAASMHRLRGSGALVSAEALLRYATLGTVALPAQAAGALIACAHGVRGTRALLALLALVALGSWSGELLIPEPDRWARSPLAYATFQLGLWALLVPATRAAFLVEDDLDRPAEARRLRAHLASAGALLAAALLWAVPAAQEALAERLSAVYPGFASTSDGWRLWSDGAVVDERHRPSGAATRRTGSFLGAGAARHAALRPLPERHGFGRPLGDRCAFGRRQLPIGFAAFERAYLVQPQGSLEAFFLEKREADGRREGQRRVLSLPEGPLSPATGVLGVTSVLGDTDPPLWLGDPESGRLWSYDFTDPEAEPVPSSLPDGERYSGWIPNPAFEVDRPWYSGEPGSFLALGERGAYAWKAGAWEPVPMPEGGPVLWARGISERGATLWMPLEEGVLLVASTEEGEAVLLLERASSPFAFELALVDTTSGERLLAHAYAPRTALERALAGAASALALLRPPPFLAAGFLSEEPSAPHARLTFRYAWWHDPLVRAGRGFGLLLAGACGSALLGFLVARRRLGPEAPPARVGLWTLACLVGGPSVALLTVAFESRRARRPAPVPPRRTQLLIGAAGASETG